jgi:hypothetical protein
MVYLSKTIPNEWKRSIIVPILKKGDKSQVTTPVTISKALLLTRIEYNGAKVLF